MTFDRVEAEEKFDRFLMVMDDQLKALQEEALSRNIKLDFSVESIEKLEKLFNLMTKNVDKESVSSMIVSFARYLGEIVRINYGGNWLLPLDDPKNANFNTPVISGHAQEGLELAPISVMRAFSLRRIPGTLKRAIDADVNVTPVDLSRLIEEESPKDN